MTNSIGNFLQQYLMRTFFKSSFCVLMLLIISFREAESAIPPFNIIKVTPGTVALDTSKNSRIEIHLDSFLMIRSEEIFLVINGIAFKQIHPDFPIDSVNKKLVFTLKAGYADTMGIWQRLNGGSSPSKSLKLEVGKSDNSYYAEASENNLTVRFFDPKEKTRAGWIAGIMFLILGVSVFWPLTTILREGSVKGAPFSLSRTQFAFWTITIFSGSVYLFILTDQIPLFTGSTLILLGISAAALASAQAIDSGYRERFEEKVRAAQKIALSAHDQLIPAQTIFTANRGQFNHYKCNGESSKGFFLDLISDKDGPNIQRFQNALATVLFGGIFINTVLCDWIFVQFSTDQLLLMGISSAAYAGGKIAENKMALSSW